MTIKTQKYNYAASGIVKKLQKKGFTIYRRPARLAPPGVVRWTVGNYKNLGPDKTYSALLDAIRDITGKGYRVDTAHYLGFGWYPILSVSRKMQEVIVYKHNLGNER